MGREHKFRLTKTQLSNRATVTAGKILGTILTVSEELGKGPRSTLITRNDNGGLTLNAGWRFRPDDGNKEPDIILSFTPELRKDTGRTKVEDFHNDADFPDKKELREKTGIGLARALVDYNDTTMMQKARRGMW